MIGDLAPELVLDAHALLGEGPSWDAVRQHLIWVDIVRGEVHEFDPASGADATYAVGQPVAAVAREGGGLVLAVRDGFASFDPATGELVMLAEVEADQPRSRMNDGKCDSAGRFWAGTQSIDLEPGVGALYRLDLDGSVARVVPGVTISNGIAWSPDDRTMYFIDTAACGVDAFDYDPATGAVGGRRLVDVPASMGGPDGMAVDEAGCLWVALWDGWALHRYAPDGRLDARVEFPVSHVTSVCFGGADLSDLYVTTAAVTETGPFDEERLRREPHSGALYRLRPGVRGLPTWPYRGPNMIG